MSEEQQKIFDELPKETRDLFISMAKNWKAPGNSG